MGAMWKAVFPPPGVYETAVPLLSEICLLKIIFFPLSSASSKMKNTSALIKKEEKKA